MSKDKFKNTVELNKKYVLKNGGLFTPLSRRDGHKLSGTYRCDSNSPGYSYVTTPDQISHEYDPIPHGRISWLIDTFSIAMTDNEVEENLRGRMHGQSWTVPHQNKAIDYGLKCHHENQTFAHDITVGNVR